MWILLFIEATLAFHFRHVAYYIPVPVPRTNTIRVFGNIGPNTFHEMKLMSQELLLTSNYTVKKQKLKLKKKEVKIRTFGI